MSTDTMARAEARPDLRSLEPIRELAAGEPTAGSSTARRVLEAVAAATTLLILSPLLLAGMAIVLVAGGRPLFFGHERVGLHGRRFRCWKLRTMTEDAERRLDEDAGLRERHETNGFKLPNGSDPRITWWGRWLRKTYLDEIPQLWNVVWGDMALVGPRPIVADELHLFGDGAGELLGVKPGIFGAWNSRGRGRPPYPERAALELDYVRHRSTLRDVRILLRSVVAVLQGQGDD